jgi:hypothetical protein
METMSREVAEKLWADVLKRKHEFYTPAAEAIEVDHQGRRVTVLTPAVIAQPERLEIRSVFGSGEFLALVGRHTLTGYDDPYERGILMIARRRDDTTYAVHVWHELYPGTLKLLGLDLPSDDESGPSQQSTR